MNRKPFQGVLNIIRFNWHFYAISGLLFVFGAVLLPYLPDWLQFIVIVGISLALLQILISLLVSWVVYDRSDLYAFKWLDLRQGSTVLNLNAGFDETSGLLKEKFPDIQLSVGDFYDSEQHTEVSIRRARATYPLFPGTVNLSTAALPFADDSFDVVLAILSAHEIRNHKERIDFFLELRRVVAPNGTIYVTEHLQDLPNFLAYSIGFLHFHNKMQWQQTFKKSGFTIIKEIKISFFITSFIIQSDGDSS